MKQLAVPTVELRPVISFAPGLYEKMLNSVGRLPPEHYALLSGSLDDPFFVTDFMPLPPLMDTGGGMKSSSVSVTLNGPFIEYYLNTVLLPAGLYPLGAIHSHPGDMDVLSRGEEGSGHGDIPSMRSHLEAAKRFEKPWHNYLAPIVTHPGERPKVTGYIVRLDRAEPIAADIVWEPSLSGRSIGGERTDKVTGCVAPQEVIARARPWHIALADLEQDQTTPALDREFLQGELRHYRNIEMAALRKESEARARAAKPRRRLPMLGFGTQAS